VHFPTSGFSLRTCVYHIPLGTLPFYDMISFNLVHRKICSGDEVIQLCTATCAFQKTAPAPWTGSLCPRSTLSLFCFSREIILGACALYGKCVFLWMHQRISLYNCFQSFSKMHLGVSKTFFVPWYLQGFWDLCAHDFHWGWKCFGIQLFEIFF
jgi:hypothetical protein